jgi:hypothetical protein
MEAAIGGSVFAMGATRCGYARPVPSSLRAQVALVGLFAVLLIPIGTSSLRGLTHILSCREEAGTPFTIQVPEEGPPAIASSAVIERDPSGVPDTGEVCGGLRMDIGIGTSSEDRADIIVTITNGSDYGWRGTVQLEIAGTLVPIDVGQIDAGESGTDSVELRLRRDRFYEIDGTLLIGP